jgi:type I restriction enzyme M protein
MITGELRSKVDSIWDTMWSGGISNPLSVIEQLTYLLFIKSLDEMHTLKEHQSNRTGKPIEEPVFAADQNHLRWSRFKETAPETIFNLIWKHTGLVMLPGTGCTGLGDHFTASFDRLGTVSVNFV